MTDQPAEAAPPQETAPETEELTVREFRADDVDGLFFLEQRCYSPPFSMTYPQLRALLKDAGTATLVVVGRVGDAPRMVAAMIVKPETERQRLMVISLMVDPDYRRLGLGRLLAERARQVAAALALPTVATPVEAENAGGGAFLQALGFAPAAQAPEFFASPEAGALWCLSLATPESP